MKTIKQKLASMVSVMRGFTSSEIKRFKTGFKFGVKFAQQWISVDDELPEHRQRVLMKTERFEYPAAGVYDYATFRDHDNNIVYDVTEWRPIELK